MHHKGRYELAFGHNPDEGFPVTIEDRKLRSGRKSELLPTVSAPQNTRFDRQPFPVTGKDEIFTPWMNVDISPGISTRKIYATLAGPQCQMLGKMSSVGPTLVLPHGDPH